MALERRDSTGGAVDTTITADITNASLSISIATSTGWPSGGANGPFFVIIDYDVAGKEKVEVASRTGTTLTVASVPKRGIDGTTAASHTSGAKIRHCHTRQDTDEANKTMAETIGRLTTKGDLTPATGANATTRLGAGANNTVLIADSSQTSGLRWGTLTSASLGTDSVGSAQIAADSVGASEIAPLAVTAAEIANDTITAAQIAAGGVGSSELGAAAVIAGKIAAGGVSASNQFAAGVVDSAALGAAAVTAGKIAAGGVSATNQITDAIVTLAKVASEATTPFANTLGGVTLGAGQKYFEYLKLGRLVLAFWGFVLGAGGDVTSTISTNLPHTPADLAPGIGNTGGLVVGRVVNAGGTVAFSGLGAVLATTAQDIITAGTGAVWDNDTPFDFGPGDIFQGLIVYVATS